MGTPFAFSYIAFLLPEKRWSIPYTPLGQLPVVPGKNKAIYLLGHLIASNDYLLPLLGFSDKLFTDLNSYFIPNTEWNYDTFPSLQDLKEKWLLLIDTLNNYINQLEAGKWLEGYTRISPEDFKIDPTRNKLNVLIG